MTIGLALSILKAYKMNTIFTMQTLSDIRTLMADDIKHNNQCIITSLSSDVALINQISQYIIQSGGKRLRPLLVMLCARALSYKGESHHKAAAIIEFIHTATLLHDDVVDESALRRGEKTANNVFGNAASVLTGDFLYSRAFQMMVELEQMSIMKVLADATNKIAEGEVLQLLNCNNPEINEQDYMNVIYCKTAKLFEAACDISAILAKANNTEAHAIHQYGIHLGNAFQIADDVLDYTSDSQTMGKNMGDDLAEGKVTLPLIYTLNHTDKENQRLIHDAIKQGHHPKMDTIIEIVQSCGAIDYALDQAHLEAKSAAQALDAISHSAYKDALILLTKLAVKRTH